jgi:hypothetical protein
MNRFLGLLGVTIILNSCAYGDASAQGSVFVRPEPSTSSRIVHIAIGGKRFAIPRNYIWGGATERRPTGLNMHAIWPGMEPMTAKNRHFFFNYHKPDSASVLKILFSEDIAGEGLGRGTYKKRIERLSLWVQQSKARRTEDGLDAYPLLPEHRNQSQHELVRIKDPSTEDTLILRCARLGVFVNASCSHMFMYSETIYIRFTTRRENVNAIPAMKEGVIRLIRSFEQ